MNWNKISFTKMHGLGNDFVVINGIDHPIDIQHLPIQQLANRHLGIGFDQLLIIESSNRANFFCRIFNSDGSEAEQCGNGLRCVARLIHEDGLSAQSSFSIETKAGIFPVAIASNDNIRVTMGVPFIQEKLVTLPLEKAPHSIAATILSLGNPHAIVKVDSLDATSIHDLGPMISNHLYFPHGANVGFMEIINRDHIRLKTFERGAGETHACGSNSCAAVAAGAVNGWLNRQVKIELRYGSLWIEWEGEGHPIHMTGPASRVFSGQLEEKYR